MRKNTSLYRRTPRKFSSERLDCSVRALSVATGRPYEVVHAELARQGRQNGKHTLWTALVRAAGNLGLARLAYVVGECGEYGAKGAAKLLTLTQFVRDHRRGRYLLNTRTHSFALIDGVVHDYRHGAGARSRITSAWRV